MRYPFAELERLVRVQLRDGATDDRIAAVLGTTRRQMYRWRDHGVDVDQADRLAVAAGFAPYEVWPEWLEDVEKTRRAKIAERQRKWRAKPEVRELERQRRRAYYAENAEYEKARERRRYATNKILVGHSLSRDETCINDGMENVA